MTYTVLFAARQWTSGTYRTSGRQTEFSLDYADLSDSMSILQVVSKVRPTEIYNLAAQSHVQVSFDSPEFTANVDATGVLRVLEAVRLCGLKILAASIRHLLRTLRKGGRSAAE